MPARRPGRKTFSELFPQLFLFPLILVAVGVLVYLFFVASAQDNRSIEELVQDIESGGPHARKQDLYALAVKVRELETPEGRPLYFDEALTRKLMGFLERSADDEKLRACLVLAIGRAGQPDLTVPVMTQAALGEQGNDEARIYAVQSLGLSRAPQAVEPLVRVLGRYLLPESWELRWNALAALANIGGSAAIAELQKAVGDPRREISWSAACWLANLHGDATGAAILRQLVDWKFLDGERGDQGRELLLEQKEQYMVMALQGLWRLEKQDALPLLTEKSREDRSFKVKDAALRLLALSQGESGAERQTTSGAATPEKA
jgi:HEAT repeat protein